MEAVEQKAEMRLAAALRRKRALENAGQRLSWRQRGPLAVSSASLGAGAPLPPSSAPTPGTRHLLVLGQRPRKRPLRLGQGRDPEASAEEIGSAGEIETPAVR